MRCVLAICLGYAMICGRAALDFLTPPVHRASSFVCEAVPPIRYLAFIRSRIPFGPPRADVCLVAVLARTLLGSLDRVDMVVPQPFTCVSAYSPRHANLSSFAFFAAALSQAKLLFRLWARGGT